MKYILEDILNDDGYDENFGNHWGGGQAAQPTNDNNDNFGNHWGGNNGAQYWQPFSGDNFAGQIANNLIARPQVNFREAMGSGVGVIGDTARYLATKIGLDNPVGNNLDYVADVADKFQQANTVPDDKRVHWNGLTGGNTLDYLASPYGANADLGTLEGSMAAIGAGGEIAPAAAVKGLSKLPKVGSYVEAAAKALSDSNFVKAHPDLVANLRYGLASAPIESAAEAGGVIEDLRKQNPSGVNPESAADSTFWGNMPTLVLSNAVDRAGITGKLIPKALTNGGKAAKAAGYGITGGIEAGQQSWEEGVQTGIQGSAEAGKGAEWWKNLNPNEWNSEQWQSFNDSLIPSFLLGTVAPAGYKKYKQWRNGSKPEPDDNGTPNTPSNGNSGDNSNNNSIDNYTPQYTISDEVSNTGLREDTEAKLSRLDAAYFDKYGRHLFVTSMRRDGDGNSHHDYGNAFDVADDNLEGNTEARRWMEQQAADLGLTPLDEYENPSDHATGGHMHFSNTTGSEGLGDYQPSRAMGKNEFFAAIESQESGGDPNAVNSSSGAYGKFQIMPGNWESWKNEAINSGLQIDPNADITDTAAYDAVAKFKLGQYYDKYGAEGACVAWYAGEGNAERWANGESTDVWGNAWNKEQSDGPSIKSYVEQTLGKYARGVGSYTGMRHSQRDEKNDYFKDYNPLGDNPKDFNDYLAILGGADEASKNDLDRAFKQGVFTQTNKGDIVFNDNARNRRFIENMRQEEWMRDPAHAQYYSSNANNIAKLQAKMQANNVANNVTNVTNGVTDVTNSATNPQNVAPNSQQTPAKQPEPTQISTNATDNATNATDNEPFKLTPISVKNKTADKVNTLLNDTYAKINNGEQVDIASVRAEVDKIVKGSKKMKPETRKKIADEAAERLQGMQPTVQGNSQGNIQDNSASANNAQVPLPGSVPTGSKTEQVALANTVNTPSTVDVSNTENTTPVVSTETATNATNLHTNEQNNMQKEQANVQNVSTPQQGEDNDKLSKDEAIDDIERDIDMFDMWMENPHPAQQVKATAAKTRKNVDDILKSADITEKEHNNLRTKYFKEIDDIVSGIDIEEEQQPKEETPKRDKPAEYTDEELLRYASGEENAQSFYMNAYTDDKTRAEAYFKTHPYKDIFARLQKQYGDKDGNIISNTTKKPQNALQSTKSEKANTSTNDKEKTDTEPHSKSDAEPQQEPANTEGSKTSEQKPDIEPFVENDKYEKLIDETDATPYVMPDKPNKPSAGAFMGTEVGVITIDGKKLFTNGKTIVYDFDEKYDKVYAKKTVERLSRISPASIKGWFMPSATELKQMPMLYLPKVYFKNKQQPDGVVMLVDDGNTNALIPYPALAYFRNRYGDDVGFRYKSYTLSSNKYVVFAYSHTTGKVIGVIKGYPDSVVKPSMADLSRDTKFVQYVDDKQNHEKDAKSKFINDNEWHGFMSGETNQQKVEIAKEKLLENVDGHTLKHHIEQEIEDAGKSAKQGEPLRINYIKDGKTYYRVNQATRQRTRCNKAEYDYFRCLALQDKTISAALNMKHAPNEIRDEAISRAVDEFNSLIFNEKPTEDEARRKASAIIMNWKKAALKAADEEKLSNEQKTAIISEIHDALHKHLDRLIRNDLKPASENNKQDVALAKQAAVAYVDSANRRIQSAYGIMQNGAYDMDRKAFADNELAKVQEQLDQAEDAINKLMNSTPQEERQWFDKIVDDMLYDKRIGELREYAKGHPVKQENKPATAKDIVDSVLKNRHITDSDLFPKMLVLADTKSMKQDVIVEYLDRLENADTRRVPSNQIAATKMAVKRFAKENNINLPRKKSAKSKKGSIQKPAETKTEETADSKPTEPVKSNFGKEQFGEQDDAFAEMLKGEGIDVSTIEDAKLEAPPNIKNTKENRDKAFKELMNEINRPSANPMFNPVLFAKYLKWAFYCIADGYNTVKTLIKKLQADLNRNGNDPWINAVANAVTNYPKGYEFDEHKLTNMFKAIGAQLADDRNATLDDVKKNFQKRTGSYYNQFEPFIEAAYGGVKSFYDTMEENNNGKQQGKSRSADGGHKSVQTEPAEKNEEERPESAGGNGETSQPSGRGGKSNTGSTESADTTKSGTAGVSEGTELDEASGKGNSTGTDKPDIPLTPAQKNPSPTETAGHNYEIKGTPKDKSEKQRHKDNVAAIKLLKQLEAENRLPTPAEQETLAKYSGWGGLTGSFKDDTAEDKELRELLTPSEYSAARATILNAYYTPVDVVRSIWKAVERLGFNGGRVLDPSMGTGNFFGAMPRNIMAMSRLTGIEYDDITSRFAKMLYQKADIKHNGYEDVSMPNNYYDLAITNVPFGSKSIDDYKIHNYFFMKSIEKVRPGGLIVFLTSQDTLVGGGDATKMRNYLSEKADMVAAYKLPRGTFKGTGTGVITDVIIMQKRVDESKPAKYGNRFVDITKQYEVYEDSNGTRTETRSNPSPINKYFKDHPENVLGQIDSVYDSRSKGYIIDVAMRDGEDVAKELAKVIKNLPENIYVPKTHKEKPVYDNNLANKKAKADQKTRDYEYYFKDGKPVQNVNGEEVVLTGKKAQVVAGYLKVKNALDALLIAQEDENATDKAIEKLRKDLNDTYDSFVATNTKSKDNPGYLNRSSTMSHFKDDPSSGRVLALERILYKPREYGVNKNGVKYKKPKVIDRIEKADIFSKRTTKPKISIANVANAKDALAASLAENGYVDIDYMAKLTGSTADKVVKELGTSIFKDPATGNYTPRDEYLSGNVREKLVLAKEEAKTDKTYNANVEELEKVVPKDLVSGEILVSMGANWIPQSDVQDFVTSICKTGHLEVKFLPSMAKWVVEGKATNPMFNSKRVSFTELVEHALQNTPVEVRDKETKQILKKPTEEAKVFVQKLQDEFKCWIWSDESRKKRLVRYYNDHFNAEVKHTYDGTHLGENFPGMNSAWKMYDHQRNAVWRIMQNHNTLLAHCVGAGKTATMQAAGMEMRRLGIVNKPLYCLPNNVCKQFVREFRELYPGVRILTINSDDLPGVRKQYKEVKDKNGRVVSHDKVPFSSLSQKEKDKVLANRAKRTRLLSRIKTEDWDAIIISHTMFERLPVSQQNASSFIQEQCDMLERSIREANDAKMDKRDIRRMEESLENLQAKLEAVLNTDTEDIGIPFEELGIDQIFVDEADLFKNLGFPTSFSRVSGISNTDANRSQDMFMKTQWLTKAQNGRGVVFATGTPISNTFAEMYNMMRYLDMQTLKEKGLDLFDNWIKTFGEIGTGIERKPSGDGFRQVTKLNYVINVPDLYKLFTIFADIRQKKDIAQHLNLPKAKDTTITLPPDPVVMDYIKNIVPKREARMKDKGSKDNMLSLTNDLRKLSLTNAKVEACAEQIAKKFEETSDVKGAQLVFADMGIPKADKDNEDESNAKEDKSTSSKNNPLEEEDYSVGELKIYQDLREALIARGVPANQIAFIHDAKNKDAQAELFQKVDRGDVRILIGSTGKMGAGTNCQHHLVALHNFDAPWRPRDLDQRRGRIERQGNENGEVEIFNYVVQDSYDAVMWEKLKNKASIIAQALSGDPNVRKIKDADPIVLSFADIEGKATGNPLIKKKLELENKVSELQSAANGFDSNRMEAEDYLKRNGILYLTAYRNKVSHIKEDIANRIETKGDKFKCIINGKGYTERKAAQSALDAAKRHSKTEPEKIGEIAGFDIYKQYADRAEWNSETGQWYSGAKLTLKGKFKDGYTPDTMTIIGLENAARKEPERELNFYNQREKEESDKVQSYKDIVKTTNPYNKELQATQAELDIVNRQIDQQLMEGGSSSAEEAPEEQDSLIYDEKENDDGSIDYIIHLPQETELNGDGMGRVNATIRAMPGATRIGNTIHFKEFEDRVDFADKYAGYKRNFPITKPTRAENFATAMNTNTTSSEATNTDSSEAANTDFFAISPYTNTRTGEQLTIVRMAHKTDAYNAINSIAKRNNGHYSSFPSARGFLFRNADDAEHFVSTALEAADKGGIQFSTRSVQSSPEAINAALDLLRQSGLKIVTDKAEMEKVLGAELKAEKPVNNVQYLKTKDGEVFGFAKDGTIYLDTEAMDASTPIHEYVHIWDNVIKELFPEVWAKGKALMKQTKLWQDVLKAPEYSNIRKNEDLVASEVHARLVGERGAAHLEKVVAKRDVKARLKDWLKEFWSKLRSVFDGWSNKQVSNMTLDDFINAPLADFFTGKNLGEQQAKVKPEATTQAAKKVANKADNSKATQITNDNSPASIVKSASNWIRDAVMKLAKKLGYKDLKSINPRITIEGNTKTADKMTLWEKWIGSPGRFAEKNPMFNVFFQLGVKAGNEVVRLRNKFNRKLDNILEVGKKGSILRTKQDKEDLFKILWQGDMEQKEYTATDAKDMGINDNVFKAYKRVRQLMNMAYNVVDGARRKITTHSADVTDEQLAFMRQNKFISIAKVTQTADGNHVVYRASGRYDPHRPGFKNRLEPTVAIVDDEAYDELSNNPAVHIYKVNNVGTNREVEYFEDIPPVAKRKGYIPHFFHDFMVRVKAKETDDDGNEVWVTKKTLKSAPTLYGAIDIANEYQLADGEQIFITPKSFDFQDKLGMSEEQASALMESTPYKEMLNNVLDGNEMTLKDAKMLFNPDGKVNNAHTNRLLHSGKHRFFGNLLQRKGVEGYEEDMEWALRHYFNMASRYAALEGIFKPNAVSLFERRFGNIKKDYSGIAKYIQDYINDVNGNPSALEKAISEAINDSWWWSKMAERYGERSALLLTNKYILNPVSFLTLGVLNVSSAMLNFTQIANSGGYLGSFESLFQIMYDSTKRGYTRQEFRVLVESGVMNDMGIDSNGYDTNRAGTSAAHNLVNKALKYGAKGMWLFNTTEQMVRRGTVLATYKKAIKEGKTHAEAVKEAQRINRQSNFEYGIADAPNVFRRGSVVAQILLQFKKYPIKQLEVMRDFLPFCEKTNTKQKLMFWSIYFAACGILGIPFIDFPDDWLGEHMGFYPKDYIQKHAMELAGDSPAWKRMANMAMYGVLGGVGINISSRAGMSDAIPTNAGALLNKGANFVGDLVGGNYLNMVRDVSPGLYNIYTALAATGKQVGVNLPGRGVSYDSRGRINTKYEDAWAILLRGMGFRSTDETNVSSVARIESHDKAILTKEKQAAINKFLDNPTNENRKAAEKLGVTPKQMEEARRKRNMSALERLKDSQPKTKPKDTKLDFLED